MIQDHIKKNKFIILFYSFYKKLRLFFQSCQRAKSFLGSITTFNSLDDEVSESDFLMALLVSWVYFFTSFDSVPKYTSDFTG